jgi:wyosine [tRNA(Phe)-imidazoG37] synthetase (radical SAM superfamily)
MAEAAQYASLVEIGQPDFIEIKGVTYCGTSDASSLTMQVCWCRLFVGMALHHINKLLTTFA